MHAKDMTIVCSSINFIVDLSLNNLLRFLSRYLDKQEFLQRADVRQFELEREERLKRFRRMY